VAVGWASLPARGTRQVGPAFGGNYARGSGRRMREPDLLHRLEKRVQKEGRMKVCLQLQAQKNVCQLEGGLELGHPKQGAPTLGRGVLRM
jgi:hypothetical protein